LCREFEYELDDHQADASATLSAQRGSCSELSRLFVAVARRCGVPARFAAGTRLRTQDEAYVDTVHHRWVEVYLKDYGWLPIDVSLNVSTQDPEQRFGAIPPRRLVLLRNAGLEGHALFSTGLTMMSRHPDLERTVRTYWYGGDVPQLKRALRDFGRAEEWTPSTCERLRRDLVKRNGVEVVPLLAMMLYPPLADGDLTDVMARIAGSRSRIAVVPLIDCVTARPETAPAAEPFLKQLTGLSHGSSELWRAWLRGEGRRFLRGQVP